ncbi:2-C-methyl-D-erythritol 4-phosphate cytidylyltransferase [Propionibacteriaceae bacterium Y2011]|uniref:2-C-methyl-D-erythritol 4-phosphate cytidylyltransferase n=1 Tax=Microlunatus sp. Y2014 TaxID=3418488 RepID=UPI003B46BD60
MQNSPEPVVAVVVAAGSGVRLGGGVPKALRELGGVPLLVHAARGLLAGGVTHLVIGIRPGDEADFARAAEQLRLGADRLRLVGGGERRQDSVRLALAAARQLAPTAQVVLVHDAARPLTPASVVAEVIASVRSGARSVVPAVPVVDSIRQLADGGSRALDRAGLVAVQTPQGFDLATLVAAHEQVAARGLDVTDDAAACEAIDVPTRLVAGSTDALKITNHVDLVVAEQLLADRAVATSDGRPT